jgi:hypothetical protein
VLSAPDFSLSLLVTETVQFFHCPRQILFQNRREDISPNKSSFKAEQRGGGLIYTQNLSSA